MPTARGRCAVWAGACGAGLATEPRRTLLLLCCMMEQDDDERVRCVSLRRRGYVSGYAFAQSNTTVDVSRRCVKPLCWTARAPQTLSRTVAGTSKPPLPRAVARAGSERRQRAALGSPFRSCSGTPGTTCRPLRRRRGRDEAFGILGGPSAHGLVQPVRPEDPGPTGSIRQASQACRS